MSGKAPSKPRAKKITASASSASASSALAPVQPPLTQTLDTAQPAPAALDAPASPAALDAPAAKTPRTRGVKKEKKPVRVVAIITPNSIEGSFTYPLAIQR